VQSNWTDHLDVGVIEEGLSING